MAEPVITEATSAKPTAAAPTAESAPTPALAAEGTSPHVAPKPGQAGEEKPTKVEPSPAVAASVEQTADGASALVETPSAQTTLSQGPPSDVTSTGAEAAEPSEMTAVASPAQIPPGAQAPIAESEPAADGGEADVAGGEPVSPDQLSETAPTAAGPVELPPEDIDLDAELEAEIEAALAAQEGTTAAATSLDVADTAAAPGAAAVADGVPDEGTRLKGRVQSIHSDDVFLELGYRSPGMVSLRQFPSDRPPEVGQEVEVVVHRVDLEEGLILCNLPTGVARPAGDWDAIEAGQTVECMVAKVNKGGLEVHVGSLRGFMPAGQVELGYVGDLEPYVGQKLQAKVIEVNPQRRNLVVSRRELLQEQRRLAEEAFWNSVEEGKVFTGKVKKLMDYGAFVDLGGTDGFLHVSQISWTRIKHPGEVLNEGDEVEVKVISVDREAKRIGLSLKQLTDNPWATAQERYPKGKTFTGTVTRIADFGAFVELEPGIEGLVHISELDYGHVKKVSDVVKEGQEVDVQILKVDTERRRISLSIKALLEKPPELKSLQEAMADKQGPPTEAEPSKPKRRRALKGGLGSSPGPLFGDPRSFGK
ncbi:MAG: S1 RNA-binding domain-containing protein [Planctomycetes bacterium]|nr:S1 RNA-binding domain-containing protein [Planctomycetota bacterium]